MRKKTDVTKASSVRCAIYTRKSTEEGLEQEFNSLDAQRDAGEAYINSQKGEGWGCVPDHYDDGGFTGANMDRPALRRLLQDIEAGNIDCVVVYKVDRLSRSLLDFSRIMETFDRHNVAFVSVTQAFNTSTSMGRLILNVLTSFAQFEREMISERTRDKIAAARRKGKWVGGMPVLGYNVEETKLVVDRLEAERVRTIFRMYLEQQSAISVAKELNELGWRTKQWMTRKNTSTGGRPFDKNSLYKVLTNITYIGKIRYKSEIHDGEHEAILDVDTFNRVQAILERNGRTGGSHIRNRHNALLGGLLYCSTCECIMSPSYSKKGSRLYRYYVCHNAQKRGWDECPAPSLPAGEIERFVIDQIKCIGRDPTLIRDTIAQTRRLASESLAHLKSERRKIERDVRKETDTERRLAGEQRLLAIDAEIETLKAMAIDESEIESVLKEFDRLWESLLPREQLRIIELLVERVTYDGNEGRLSITYRQTGIRTLALEIANRPEEAA